MSMFDNLSTMQLGLLGLVLAAVVITLGYLGYQHFKKPKTEKYTHYNSGAALRFDSKDGSHNGKEHFTYYPVSNDMLRNPYLLIDKNMKDQEASIY